MTDRPPWSPAGAEEPVLIRADGPILWIVINRPEVRNAIAPDHRHSITEALEEASADRTLRAVVLTGAGGNFCAGADLRAAADSTPVPGDQPAGVIERMVVRGVQRLVGAVMECEKPVLAAVTGAASGVGANLALACDLVLAAPSASFSQAFVKRGLVPDGGGTYLLPHLVGPMRAKELLFFGDPLSAAQACDAGLVNRVVDDEELYPTAEMWAQRLAAGPTRAITLTKRLIHRSLETGRAAAFEAEAAAVELNSHTEDSAEGLRSYGERRLPRFQGS